MQYDAKLPTEIFCESTSGNSDSKIDKISADAENEFLKNTSIIIETLKQQSNQKVAPRSHNSSPLPGVVPKQPNKMAVSHSVNNNYDSFKNGIEAMDVGSLLEQFEEAAAAIPGSAMLQPEPSKGLGSSVWATSMGNSTQAEVLQSSTPRDPFSRVPSRKNRPGALADTEVERIMMNSRLSHSAPVSPAGTPPGTPPADLLKKFKGSASVTKRKTAILLPMGGMPSKGQRGKLFEHTAKYASRRLQKIINKQPGVLTEEEVLCNYYNPISDHDYCQNFKISDQKAKCYSECAEEDHSGTLNIKLSGQSQKGSTQNGQVVENTKTNNLPVIRINSPSLMSHTSQIVKLQTPVTERRVDSVPNMSFDDLGAPGGSGVLKHLLLNTDMRYSSSPLTAQETYPAQAETNCVEAVKLPLEKGCMKENVEPEPVSVGQVSNMDNGQTQDPVAEVDQHDSDGDDTKSTRFSKFHNEQEADCDTTVHDMQIDSDDGTESNEIIESRPAETWKRGHGRRGRGSRGAGNRGRGGRAYRKKESSPIREDDQAEYFSKVPSYMTALAKPALVKNQEEKHNLINDNMPERDPSPDRSDPMFDKVPAYYSCFSNSTKYDKNSDPLAIDNDSDSRSVIRPSCSRSPSPDIVVDKKLRKYRSRSRSRYSRRRSSRSWSRSRSRSCSCSGCESKSRSRSRSRSYRRSYSRSRSYSGSRSYRQTSRNSPRGRKRSYYSSSRSRSRSYSYSRSRSRSYSRDRSWSRSRSRSGSRHRHHHKRRRYSRSYERMLKERREQIARERDEEKKQQKEERRIVYVGGISSDATRKQLKNMFLRFGDIEETSVHFREVGDNYGFVTFAYQCDAYAAIENSRKLPDLCKYDLCFGGRREFCKENYADLDGNKEMEEEIGVLGQGAADMDFDQLLKMALKKK